MVVGGREKQGERSLLNKKYDTDQILVESNFLSEKKNRLLLSLVISRLFGGTIWWV